MTDPRHTQHNIHAYVSHCGPVWKIVISHRDDEFKAIDSSTRFYNQQSGILGKNEIWHNTK